MGYIRMKVKVVQLCPTLCDPMDYTVHGILQAIAGSLSLIQGIFPTQELNPGLLNCRQILYQLSCQESLNLVEIVNVIEIIVVENVRGRIYI